MSTSQWSRHLLAVGLAGMLLGIIDPLEGSVVIVAGTALVTVAAYLGRSRYRTLMAESFALVLLGVTAMFVLSAYGGVGGTTGRSYWWATVVLAYPIGWIMGLVGAVRRLRERPVT